MRKRVRIGVALFVVSVVSLVASLAYTTNLVGSSNSTKTQGSSTPITKNILVMGADERPHDAGRSDTLMLLKIDGTNKTVDGVSIPRDAVVEIPGHGFAKVNSAYGYGGPKLVTQTVERLLGVKVDAYVSVNFDEFAKLIDRFGGVKITVDEDMQYADKAGNLNINIKKGTQVLDGQAALDFVRFRHDNLADLGRIKRQQEFLQALAGKLTNPKMALGALKTLDKTNLKPVDLLALIPAVRDRGAYRFSFETAAGASVKLLSGWYYILDSNREEARAALEMSPSGQTDVAQNSASGPDANAVTVTPVTDGPTAVPPVVIQPSSYASAPASPTGGMGAE